jgi:hypothetical protein
MTVTNLLTNMVVLTLQWPYISPGDVPTNTPAFQNYALHVMFTNAQDLAAKLNLDTNLIATNKVTEFEALATVFGVRGDITFAGRYNFSYRFGKWMGFIDQSYNELLAYSEIQKQRSKRLKKALAAHNLLNDASATTLAETRFRALGTAETSTFTNLTEKQTSDLVDDETRDMPFYQITWEVPWTSERRAAIESARRRTGPPAETNRIHKLKPPAKEVSADTFSMIISGLTEKVVWVGNSSPYFKMASPTNYLELLGYPPNTLFVAPRRSEPGKPPEYETIDLKP